ncbi:NAD(+)/NADH kinase [Candidatus Oleimmundimicrobium sp.]|uniref:NAD(+)/NADH kinase n=1 Tax=Candidatus Oleimmundimicrobium sp. TaxID=3060597 RepID=UPI00271C8DF9|nr:NAD(+)/NADH kinase [Candidatus Oleimmundimicrobium sp.]MDO8886524.1 NAD(+)/NADH kinase [Candidatus Oleimmundimicrobium sp.]
MKRIAIVIHTRKPKAKKVALKLIPWLNEQNIKVLMTKSDALDIGHVGLGVEEDVFTEKADLLIALGGDGTILRAVRLLKGRDAPILGVNLGKLGFLAEVNADKLFNVFSQIIKGKYKQDRRMLLRCEIIKDDKVIFTQDVLNEVVAGRGARHRLTKIEVDINGKPFKSYSADSVIFSTPTGSTAYSLSAGGPIVSPKTKLIIMTPVCPHSFFNRSIVLSKEDEIILSCPDKQKGFTLSFDGITHIKEENFSYLRISISPNEVSLIRLAEYDFYTTLKEKLDIWTRMGD